MDGRALTATTATGITACTAVWMNWSKKVGLTKNSIKTQLTARGPKQQEELRAHVADLGLMQHYAVAADVLGVSIGARRKLTEKEQKRVDDTAGHTLGARMTKHLYKLGWVAVRPFHRRREENEIDRPEPGHRGHGGADQKKA